MRWFYEAVRVVIVLGSKIWLNVSFEGKENIPESGGYIVACNHRSNWDPPLLAEAFPRQVFFMAKEELFRIPVLGQILRWVGAFGVERGAGDFSALDHAVKLIEQGGLLGIFPEGTRSKDGKPLRPKSGMAMIARQAKAGVIPCAVVMDGPVHFRSKVKIKIGKPISYEELFPEESNAAVRRATKMVMGQIIDMMELPPEEAGPAEGSQA